MNSDEMIKLVHLTHQLRCAINSGNADWMSINLNDISFNETEDLALVMQMANAIMHGK